MLQTSSLMTSFWRSVVDEEAPESSKI